MGRYLVVWLRNRLLAIVGFAFVASVVGGAGIGALRILGDGFLGVVVAAVLSLGTVMLMATHPWPNDQWRRLANDERALDPRRKL